jgi:hypothetical protein
LCEISGLEAAVAEIRAAFASYLRACGTALVARRASPLLEPMEAALHCYTKAREGLTLKSSADAAERFVAFGFALEQMMHDTHDLARWVNEWASTMRPARPFRTDLG